MDKYDRDRLKAKACVFINALNSLAVEGIPYSLGSSKILWELSLYLSTGAYTENWKRYPRASVAAEVIRSNKSPIKELKKLLRFEHPQPLVVIYAKITDYKGSLSLQHCADIIAEYPPVLITRQEDDEIRFRKLHRSGSPEERYQNIALDFPLLAGSII